MISKRVGGLADDQKQDRPMARVSAYCSIVAGHIQKLRVDNEGATAIEYAMIAGGIAGAIIVTVQALGTKVTALYDSLAAMM
jgi:Flp pilus assembly pilin Flp